MIRYIKGDATDPQAKGSKVIVHCCNDIGAWGAGFVMALSKKWPITRESYIQWYNKRKENDFKLGAVQLIQVRPDIQVANLVGQKGIKTGSKGAPVRYSAILEGFKHLNKTLHPSVSIHMPRMGCGLAGGKWEQIEPLVTEAFPKREVTVYDFE